MLQRNKFIIAFIFVLAATAVAIYVFTSEKQADSFGEWYGQNASESVWADSPDFVPHSTTPLQETIESEFLNIDRIFRSMQGPYEVKPMQLNGGKSELIWITGYDTKIVDENNAPLSDGLMCHNNLNIVDKAESPWRIKTHGTNIRLFTLTEGQTAIKLPEGFGVPLVSDVELEVVSQVLNHNDPNLNVKAKHVTNITYVRDEHLKTPLIPLYQQSVFVTKQTSGPVGVQGSNLMCNAYEIDSSGVEGNQPNNHDNSTDVPYNPYIDAQGRQYTGHWSIPKGEEVLGTVVTKMLNLEFDTHIHYIGAHLHPFATSLSLVDLTTGDTLHTIYASNHPDKVGLRNIESYSSAEGIPVYASHEYAAISSYNCNDDGEHTAMATLFMYLRDEPQ